MSEKGVEFKGGSFMMVLAVLTVVAVLESILPYFCLSYKIPRGSRDGFGGLAVVAVSVVMATPLKLNPPPPLVHHPDK